MLRGGDLRDLEVHGAIETELSGFQRSFEETRIEHDEGGCNET